MSVIAARICVRRAFVRLKLLYTAQISISFLLRSMLPIVKTCARTDDILQILQKLRLKTISFLFFVFYFTSNREMLSLSSDFIEIEISPRWSQNALNDC